MSDSTTADVLRLTARIVSAHVAKNQLGADALPGLIQSVYQTLATVKDVAVEPEALSPAVPWKRSVFNEHIICLEDGAKLKMLKRYLRTRFNLTPNEYRAKWGLPSDYPMVAPEYANMRSALAKSIGLGRRSSTEPATEQEPQVTVGRAPRAKGTRGRRLISIGR